MLRAKRIMKRLAGRELAKPGRRVTGSQVADLARNPELDGPNEKPAR